MFFSILHFISCLVLIGAATRQQAKPGARRFLFPFAMVSGLLAGVRLPPRVVEGFIAECSGALHYTAASVHSFTGPPWWIYVIIWGLPFAPVAAIFPAIERRPSLVEGLAFVAIVPHCLGLPR